MALTEAQRLVQTYKDLGYKVERYDAESVVLTKEISGTVVEQVVRRRAPNQTRSRR